MSIGLQKRSPPTPTPTPKIQVLSEKEHTSASVQTRVHGQVMNRGKDEREAIVSGMPLATQIIQAKHFSFWSLQLPFFSTWVFSFKSFGRHLTSKTEIAGFERNSPIYGVIVLVLRSSTVMRNYHRHGLCREELTLLGKFRTRESTFKNADSHTYAVAVGFSLFKQTLCFGLACEGPVTVPLRSIAWRVQ